MSFEKQIKKFSLILLGGTFNSLQNVFDELVFDLNASGLFYFRRFKSSDKKKDLFELFVFSLTGTRESTGKKIILKKDFPWKKGELESMEDFIPIDLPSEILPDEILINTDVNKAFLYPCFEEEELHGFFVVLLKGGGKKEDLGLLKEISGYITRTVSIISRVKHLEISKQRYREIIENLEDGYFELDLKGNLTAFNNSICRIANLKKKEVLGLNNRDYTTPETAKDMYRVFSEVAKADIPLKIKNYEIILKNGEKKWIEFSASLKKDHNGHPIGFRGLARDVTAKVKGEEERRFLEEKLSHSKKLESVGRLAGGIAHDFNNILMAIQGNISLINAASPNNNLIKEKSKIIEDCIENGANLTGQLLGYAMGGKYILRQCNLNSIVELTIVLLSNKRNHVDIKTDLTKNLLNIEGDPVQLEQVLMSLYSNAVDAVEKGGIIKIKTSNRVLCEHEALAHDLCAGEFVEVEVSDTGVGIDEGSLKKIFEPFYTTKGQSRRKGLGLASAFGIVKNHGGFINVESKIGKGSCFKICFPALRKNHNDQRGDLKVSGSIRNTANILIVDDEKKVLEVCASMLVTSGFSVETACGGIEAVSMLRENPYYFDLVILDLLMPDLNGIDTFSEMRKIQPDLKVLFAGSRNNEFLKFKEDFFRDKKEFLVMKPYNMAVLLGKIREICP